METNQNQYLCVSYELYVGGENGKELVETAPKNRPFRLITGIGFALDAFEAKLKSLNEGDAFDFTIPCGDAFGEFDESRVIDYPKAAFEVNGKFDTNRVYEGNVIPLQNEEGTYQLGTVVAVSIDTVTVDLNHPLAGKDLNFVGTLLESRPATNEEIQHVIKMMSGEGCGGCCGGDCGGDCGDGECGCGNCH